MNTYSRIGLKLLASIGCTELLIMTIFRLIRIETWMSPHLIDLSDVLLLCVMASFLILYWVVKPMKILEEREKAKEAVASLARFPEENPAPVMRFSFDGAILYANSASLPLRKHWSSELGQKVPADLASSILDVCGTGVSKEVEVVCGDTIFSLIMACIKNAQYVNVYGRDITERKWAEDERNKMLLWQQGISLIQQSLLAPAPLEDKLKLITDSIVRLFEADFCRIWLIRPGDLCERGCVHGGVQEGPHVCRYRDRCLHLLTSSGRYTHIDGKVHRRVPFGAYKIGRIASNEDHKFLTNDVTNDPRVHNHEWARELGLVSFAGYQLRIPGAETLGVLALFTKHPILPAEDALLDALSSALAQAIQQAQGEEALRTSEFFLNKLLETIPVPVFYKDREGRYLGFNKTFETFFGKSKEELIGKSVFDINPTELAKVYHAQDTKLFENPGVQVYDSQVRDAHGALHDVIFHKASLTDTQGSITGLVGAILDVTERKRAEEELQRYLAELTKNNKDLQDALANVKQLSGMLPICASCKQIRDDKGYWNSVESYIAEHSEAEFTHGICPECEKKMYADLDKFITEND